MSIHDSMQYGEWAVSVILSFIVAWQKFGSPPTNRSGTTFGLFFFGAIFYFAMIIALWLFVMVLIQHGVLGLTSIVPTTAPLDADARRQIEQFAPLVAALFIVAASQFPKVGEIDVAARNFLRQSRSDSARGRSPRPGTRQERGFSTNKQRAS